MKETKHHQPPRFLFAVLAGILIALFHQLSKNFPAHGNTAFDSELKIVTTTAAAIIIIIIIIICSSSIIINSIVASIGSSHGSRYLHHFDGI